MQVNSWTIPPAIYQATEAAFIKCHCLLDEHFMAIVFEDHPECLEPVLRIILNKEDLSILEYSIQKLTNIEDPIINHYRFDIVATDSSCKIFNVVFQKAFKDAKRHFISYDSIIMDFDKHHRKNNSSEYPETFAIYITEEDIFGHGLPIYHIDRYVSETQKLLDDKEHILYVNGAYRDDTPLGKLLYDFSCEEPDFMNYALLADRTRYIKDSEEEQDRLISSYGGLYFRGWILGFIKGFYKDAFEAVRTLLKETDLKYEEILDFLKLSGSIKEFFLVNKENFLN